MLGRETPPDFSLQAAFALAESMVPSPFYTLVVLLMGFSVGGLLLTCVVHTYCLSVCTVSMCVSLRTRLSHFASTVWVLEGKASSSGLGAAP